MKRASFLERVGWTELDAAFAAHSDGALEEAYRRHAPALEAAARHVLGTSGDARDCVHDALFRVWAKDGAYRTERGSPKAFLIVCVRNEAISRKRSSARHVASEQRAAVTTPTFGIDVAERVAVRKALRFSRASSVKSSNSHTGVISPKPRSRPSSIFPWARSKAAPHSGCANSPAL